MYQSSVWTLVAVFIIPALESSETYCIIVFLLVRIVTYSCSINFDSVQDNSAQNEYSTKLLVSNMEEIESSQQGLTDNSRELCQMINADLINVTVGIGETIFGLFPPWKINVSSGVFLQFYILFHLHEFRM